MTPAFAPAWPTSLDLARGIAATLVAIPAWAAALAFAPAWPASPWPIPGKVVSRLRGTDQRRGRVVLVDEHRTSRVSSAVNSQQPCEEELDHEHPTRPAGWKPPAGQVEYRLLRPAWSHQRDQPVRGLMLCPAVAPRKPPQAPWSSQAATQPADSEPGPSTPTPAKRRKHSKQVAPAGAVLLARKARPAKGKEFPGLGYKRVRDKPSKAQQQQPVVAQ
ncbi:hypothetical protein QJQ45_008401 [Haematococcus lacustris]|nr:hypothetical protein QJQ45_008401 [Haematococcus lacustris]